MNPVRPSPLSQLRRLSEHSIQRLARSGFSWPLIFGTLFFLGWLGRASETALSDPDTYMHLRIGEWILTHGAIPHVDIFSYTQLGKPWVAHEWLSDVILFLIHQYAGWTGLIIVSVGLCAMTLAYTLRTLLLREVPPVYALLFTILAATSVVTHLLARPHILVLPILATWFITLTKAVEQPHRPPWWLLVLMLLWANLHGSFVLGLALLLPLALESVLSAPPTQRKTRVGWWGLFALLALLASLITPYGLKGIIFTYDLLTQPKLSNIQEWQPADFSALTGFEVWILVLLGLAGLGFLRLHPIRLFLILGLLHEALAHVRYVAIFGLLTPILIAKPFSSQYAKHAKDHAANSWLDKVFNQLARPAKNLTALLTGTVAFILSGFILSVSTPTPPASTTPSGAVDAAIAAGLGQLPVYNEYAYGGYLIYRGIPVYIDGRADMYGTRYVQDYLDAIDPTDSEGFSKTLDERQIEWTLFRTKSPQTAYLDRQTGWEVFYTDDHSTIHRRRHPETPTVSSTPP